MRDARTNRGWTASTTELIFQWFHRLVAIYCLIFGLLYWVRLIGIYEGAAWRFDLMPVHWQIAAVALAVLFPFAASGLWMVASWGAVIWTMCAVAEVVMYAGFPELFGRRDLLVVAHLCVALLYLALRFALLVQKRARAN
jgi:hypothetical protein